MRDAQSNFSSQPIDLGFCRITTFQGREDRHYFDVEFTDKASQVKSLQEDGVYGSDALGKDGVMLHTTVTFSRVNIIEDFSQWLRNEKGIASTKSKNRLNIAADIATVTDFLREKGVLSGRESELVSRMRELHQQRDLSVFVLPPALIQEQFMLALLDATSDLTNARTLEMRNIERYRQAHLDRNQRGRSDPEDRPRF